VNDLRQVSVIGLGLLGGSIALATRQRLPEVSVVGYSHRAATRKKVRELGFASRVCDSLADAVEAADVVILATPIFTFEAYFTELSAMVPDACIVTDVGSTKVMPHMWAARCLDARARYVGSHPIAGSEQRGAEFARDDLFDQSRCILTSMPGTPRPAIQTLRRYWSALGCSVRTMTPEAHDRVFANISHLPHVIAAGLVNASDEEDMRYAGKGFLDSTRISSGPASIWTDVLLANQENIAAGIDRVIAELSHLQSAIRVGERAQIEALLDRARKKRSTLVKYKIRKKELPA
jgi:prephenate dehydrogenase